MRSFLQFLESITQFRGDDYTHLLAAGDALMENPSEQAINDFGDLMGRWYNHLADHLSQFMQRQGEVDDLPADWERQYCAGLREMAQNMRQRVRSFMWTRENPEQEIHPGNYVAQRLQRANPNFFNELDRIYREVSEVWEHVRAAMQGYNYVRYAMGRGRPGLSQRLSQFLGRQVKVVREGGNTFVVIESFEDWPSLYEFLHRHSQGRIDDFSWLEEGVEIDMDWRHMDVKDYVSYFTKDEEQRIEKMPAPKGIDADDWAEMDVEERVTYDELSHAIFSAVETGYRWGTERRASRDIQKSLSAPDERGFFVDFRKHPWTLRIRYDHLEKLLHEDDQGEEGNDSWLDMMGLEYQAGDYEDFSEEGFHEDLGYRFDELGI